jgi:Tol biopolymer transport system component
VSAAGGVPERLTRDREYDVEPVWAADGNSVYFSSYRGGVFALWQVGLTGGVPVRVTRGAGPERHPTISRTGGRLAFASFAENLDLVIHDLTTGQEQRLGTTRDEMSPAFSHDGRRIVYVVDSGPRGGTELWLQPIIAGKPDGQPQRLLEVPGAVSHPEFSPDDRWVVFQRTLSGSRDIWTVPTDGGTLNRFTDDPADEWHPTWSPDGSSIAFVSARSGTPCIWIAAVASGLPVGSTRRVTRGRGADAWPAWSRDGGDIAYVSESASGSEVWVTRADGSKPRQVTKGADARFVRWDRSSATILVSGTWGATSLSIRRVDHRSGESRPLQGVPEMGPNSARPMFDLSRDGRLISMSRGAWTGDIWVSDVRSQRP